MDAKIEEIIKKEEEFILQLKKIYDDSRPPKRYPIRDSLVRSICEFYDNGHLVKGEDETDELFELRRWETLKQYVTPLLHPEDPLVILPTQQDGESSASFQKRCSAFLQKLSIRLLNKNIFPKIVDASKMYFVLLNGSVKYASTLKETMLEAIDSLLG